MKINVKWGKELLKDVEVDMGQPPVVLKLQLYSLTGVPPDRQKVMGKGGLLGDDEWGKVSFKQGMTVIMMGTADKLPEAPAEQPKFVEDLPEDEQAAVETRQYGSGLVNLGNTCYMNSCMQCLYAVPELREKLSTLPAGSGNALAVQAGRLFKDMERGGTVTPGIFLQVLRSAVPQFDQLASSAGPTGMRIHAQQDAEECWTQVIYAWKNAMAQGNTNPIDDLFQVQLKTNLKCAESDESTPESSSAYMLKCNVTIDVNHLNEGLKLGLVEDREKNSAALGRLAQWHGESRITKVPPYLTVQIMRFFYKVQTQSKAKIMRKVTFPLQLDLFEFCSEELCTELKGPRMAFKRIEDARVGIKDKAPANAAADAAAAGATADGDDDGDSAMNAPETETDHTGALTGRYDLIAVLTHKGRSADSGHYVGWVKQADGSWVEFDDDTMIPRKDEDILQLGGGGDWHTAYLMLFKAQRVPAKATVEAISAHSKPMES